MSMKYKARKVKPNLAKPGRVARRLLRWNFLHPAQCQAPRSGKNDDLFQLVSSHVWQKQLQVAFSLGAKKGGRARRLGKIAHAFFYAPEPSQPSSGRGRCPLVV